MATEPPTKEAPKLTYADRYEVPFEVILAPPFTTDYNSHRTHSALVGTIHLAHAQALLNRLVALPGIEVPK